MDEHEEDISREGTRQERDDSTGVQELNMADMDTYQMKARAENISQERPRQEEGDRAGARELSIAEYSGGQLSRISTDAFSQIILQKTQNVEVQGNDMPVFTGPVISPTFHIHAGAQSKDIPTPPSPTELGYCQQQVITCYQKTAGTIPAHPLDPTRTVPIDKFFFNLELIRALQGKKMSHEHVSLSGQKLILDKPQTISLRTWEDLFRPEIMETDMILLSGGAGFGKSTLLLKVANASAVRDPNSPLSKFKLVFLVKLRQMENSSCIVDAIFSQFFPKDTEVTKLGLKQLIADNEAEIAFLLDGLDEIPTDVLKSTQGIYSVKDILTRRVLLKSWVVVTTRPHMVDCVLKGYPHCAQVQALGFTSETVNKYIESYFGNSVSSRDALISYLKSNQTVQTLAQIPIISLFLCIIWENKSKLSQRLTELYTEFAEILVKRRCNEGEDAVKLMEAVLRGLGQVALKGLLDPGGERLIFDSDEFDIKVFKDGCRLGFLQEESFTSGLKIKKVGTFLHKSFQEYCAAYFMANLNQTNKTEFRVQLRQINSDNVHAMEYLLRFACGISSGFPATGLILEHVQKMKGDKKAQQKLARLLLFESNSDSFVGMLDRPTDISCASQEDLLSLHYYSQRVSSRLVANFFLHCRSYDDLTLLKDILLNGKIKPGRRYRILYTGALCVYYTISEEGNEELQFLEEILGSMDEKLREKLELTLEVDKASSLESDAVSGRLYWLSHKVTVVTLRDRSFNGASEIVNRLGGCSPHTLRVICVTDLHGHVADLRPLVSPLLTWLELYKCGLHENDATDVNLICKSCARLDFCNIDGNAFTSETMKALNIVPSATRSERLVLQLLRLRGLIQADDGAI